MKKILLLIVAALVVPSVALAAKPAHGPKPATKVTYMLKGTLSSYTAYDAGTSTNGTITIVVSSANYHGKALKGQTLTFAVDAHTMIALKSGLTTITDGDSGMIDVRAAAKIPPANLAATLQASPAARINDRGVKAPHMVTYVLAGTLSAYTAYDKVTPANGTVTIHVNHAMPRGKALKGQTLVLAIDANTKVSLGHKLTTITDGDMGLIKVRAAAGVAAADLAATLQAAPAKQVVDQGPKHKH